MKVYNFELQGFKWNGMIFSRIVCPGCNFRCGYCFVPDAVFATKWKSGNEVFETIKSNRVMQGVCITGGEPSLQADLPIFLKKIKLLGLKTMLETNGSNPEMLEKLIKRKLVDFVRIDVKAPKEKYDLVTGKENSWQNVEKSLKILEKWTGYWEAITVWHPLMEKEDLERISKLVKGKWVIRKFETGKLVDPSLNKEVQIDEEFLETLSGPREIWVRKPEYERRIK